MMCSRLVRRRPDRHHVHVADGLADDGERVVPDLPIGNEVIGPDEVARVDARLRHKLVDVDGAGKLERDVFQLILGHLDVGVGIHLVALDDVVVRNLFARIGVNLGVFDTMAGLLVDLVEADLLGIGSGRVQSDRAGNEGKAQKAFPVGTGGHWVLQTQLGIGGYKTILVHSFLQSSFKKFTLQTRSTFVLMS